MESNGKHFTMIPSTLEEASLPDQMYVFQNNEVKNPLMIKIKTMCWANVNLHFSSVLQVVIQIYILNVNLNYIYNVMETE